MCIYIVCVCVCVCMCGCVGARVYVCVCIIVAKTIFFYHFRCFAVVETERNMFSAGVVLH